VLAQGGYWGFLIGGALFHLTSILDGVDGELARLKFKSSLYGKWLDFMCDNLAYLAALVGFLVGLFRDGISPFEKVASLTALGLTLCMMTSIILYYKRFNKDGRLLTVEYGFREGTGWFDRLMQWAEMLGKREWFALIFFSLSIFGKLQWALVYVCLVAAGVLLFSFEAHARAGRVQSDECKMQSV
jgi:phosphatidylglycerophosphate synthase